MPTKLLGVSLAGLAIGMAAVAVPAEYQPVSTGSNQLEGSRQVQEEPSYALGKLNGTVTIGPVCLVEQPERQCLPGPAAFQAVTVTVSLSGAASAAKILKPDPNGLFSLDLPPGEYDVLVRHPYMTPQDYRQHVIIRADQTTDLQIELGTGIH